jgi:heptosyltransferase-2
MMQKILIRVPNHLGDTLMAQPAVTAFAGHRPHDDIHLLMPAWAAIIYSGIPHIQMILLDNRHLHGPAALLRQVSLLKAARFDAGILLTPSFSSALILRLAKVKTRYGYTGAGRSFLLSNPIADENQKRVHRSRAYFRIMEAAVGDVLGHDQPRLKPSEKACEKAKDILSEGGIDLSGGLAVISPQAVAPSRRWGHENYRALAIRLVMERGYKVVLLGTQSEYGAGEMVARSDRRILNICGKTDIETAAAVLSMAVIFIGNDSGLAHLAAAVNVPLVVLSGADNPVQTSPAAPNKTVIIKDYLDCISCVKNHCPKRGDAFMKCMKEITVAEVYDAAGRLLE